MGFFSWKCALSNVEIANKQTDMPSWMKEIVVQTEEGEILEGIYDGFGRIETKAGEVVDFYKQTMEAQRPGDPLQAPRVALAEAYSNLLKAGLLDPEGIPRAGQAEWQGHWFPEDYEHNAHEQIMNMV